MPLYININGARREIIRMYANVNGVQREIGTMYANVNGSQRIIFQHGAKYYRIAPVNGSETLENGTYYSGSGFQIDAVHGRFQLSGDSPQNKIPEGAYYLAAQSPFDVQYSKLLKRAQIEARPLQTITYWGWRIDFESTDPNAVQTVMPQDTGEQSYFVDYDHNLNISTNHLTFYRWDNSAYTGKYWFRTYDVTPEGYIEDTKTIIR